MGADHFIKLNSDRPDLTYQVTDSQGRPTDLSNANEIYFVMWHYNSGEKVINDSDNVSIVNASEGQVKYDFQQNQIFKQGLHKSEFKIEYQDGDTEWVEHDENIDIYVASPGGDRSQNLSQLVDPDATVKILTVSDKIKLEDSGKDPSQNGDIRRNGDHIKFYSGGKLINISGGEYTETGVTVDSTGTTINHGLGSDIVQVEFWENGSIINTSGISIEKVDSNNIEVSANQSTTGDFIVQGHVYNIAGGTYIENGVSVDTTGTEVNHGLDANTVSIQFWENGTILNNSGISIEKVDTNTVELSAGSSISGDVIVIG